MIAVAQAPHPVAEGWGAGAREAVRLGEGDPPAWQEIGLAPLPVAWQRRRAEAGEAFVGLAGRARPAHVRRVLGGACIHRCLGDPAQLPVSTVWEILGVAMVARRLGVPGVVLLPVAEEVHRIPPHAGAFRRLGTLLAAALPRFGRRLGVELEACWHEDLSRDPGIERHQLYGLFNPFSASPVLRTYPLGRPDEAAILRAHESYCARYRRVVPPLGAADLLCEALPVGRSIRLGIRGTGASYLAAVPLPSPAPPHRLLSDAPEPPRLGDPFEAPPGWWPERVVRETFGLGLEALLGAFAEILATTTIAAEPGEGGNPVPRHGE